LTLQDLSDFLDGLDRPRIFWWRDDDTGNDERALSQFLAFRRRVGVPLVISAVPAWLSHRCGAILAEEPQTFVAQHGFDHSDHAAAGEKSVELGGTAAPNSIVERLRQGKAWLHAKEFQNLLALLVPPWNRLSDDVVAQLPDIGFRSLSTYAKDRRGMAFGLKHINCHIDPIVWREGKRQMSETELCQVTIEQLSNGADRPTGLLTHHLEMDDNAYSLLGDYLQLLGRHPKIKCHCPSQLFGLANAE